ncbi:MAG: BatA domain-containing protein [Luteolibacter sp.]
MGAVIVFANPLGLLALLGVPAVLAIHLLQRRAVEVPVATMFLLDRIMHEPSVGRRFDRILPSLSLFLQLLAVLLLAWVISGPSFPREGSVARVAVVLDSSASMWPFRERAIEALGNALPRLQGTAAEIELTVLDADPRAPMVFAGTSVAEAAAYLRMHWQPRGAAVEPSRALRIARSRVSHEGAVVYLTDTLHERLPHDAVLLAVGRNIDNVGFTGVAVTGEPGSWRWRATVRNYAASAQSREWALHTAAGMSSPRMIELPANGVATIEGAFPEGAERVRLEMTGDEFPLDDVLSMVIPKPKQLMVRSMGGEVADGLAGRLVAAVDGLEAAGETHAPRVDFWVAGAGEGALPEWGAVIAFAADAGDAAREWRKGAVFAEAHPLVNGLNWQPLAVRKVPGFAARPSDQVLVWQGEVPLVMLRGEAGGERLLMNFDLAKSNAATLPAFVVMLHRFVERVRDARIAPEVMMLEAGQRIRLAHDPGMPLEIVATDVTGVSMDHAGGLVAPQEPGFLTIDQGGVRLLDAAVFFADTAEADFSSAGEADTLGDAALAARDRHARADPWWQLWVLVLLAAVIATWKFTPIRHPERA